MYRVITLYEAFESLDKEAGSLGSESLGYFASLADAQRASVDKGIQGSNGEIREVPAILCDDQCFILKASHPAEVFQNLRESVVGRMKSGKFHTWNSEELDSVRG